MSENEGEFKKQLVDLLASRRDAPEFITVHDSMDISLAVVDKALQDFPFTIFFNSSMGGENSYSFYLKNKPERVEERNAAVIMRGVAEWLERWFIGKSDSAELHLVNPDKKES